MNINDKIICDAPFLIREVMVNMYGFYLSKKRFNSEYDIFYSAIMKNLEKSADEIKDDQFRLMKDNLINAYENIPYYSKLFNDFEFSPYKISSLSEITKIPFLDKDIIRKNYDLLINKRISKRSCVSRYTSGTTGEKLRFILPVSLAYPKNVAILYRFYSMAGVSLRDKRITIGGRRFTNKIPYWSYNIFENQMLLSAHHLNDRSVNEYINQINKFNPVFIQGHPNSILFIAQAILRRSCNMTDSLRIIFTTGETLTNENRLYIEKAFGVRVLQQYGSGESCFSAQETGDDCGYMVNYEHGYVELIGNDEYKEIVATSFQNDVMPFVRYKIGDYVKALDGAVLNKKYDYPYLFNYVIGRIDDVITSVDGSIIFPVAIRSVVKQYLKDFTGYQFCQYGDREYELRLVDEKKEVNINALLRGLRGVLGMGSEISCIYVDSLISDGGKIRNVINKNKVNAVINY